MKVILVNGSMNEHGSTNEALEIIKEELLLNEIDSEIIWIGEDAINDVSHKEQKVDVVNLIGEKMKEADGLIVGSPTWYAHPTGRLLCVLDRLSTEYSSFLAYKPAASIMCARRAGQIIANDIIEKHFSINNMPIVTSSYWNLVYGSKPSEVREDEEGVATMRNLANNMAWLLKCISKAEIEHPVAYKKRTNFIR